MDERETAKRCYVKGWWCAPDAPVWLAVRQHPDNPLDWRIMGVSLSPSRKKAKYSLNQLDIWPHFLVKIPAKEASTFDLDVPVVKGDTVA